VQDISPEYRAALKGSYVPTCTVDAWYDGRLILAGVPMESGSVTVDGSRTISGSLTLTAAKADDSLVPDRWDAPLAPFGSQLHVRSGAKLGGTTEQVSLGWYRIDEADPQEWWTSYTPDFDVDPTQTPRWVCRGMQVTVQASDRMALVDDDAFVSPEAPASTTSVIAEIQRLVQDIVPVADLTGITDAAIPAIIAYQTSRVQAIQDLANVLGRTARIDPNGALTLIPKVPSMTPVWSVTVGVDGDIINWGRKLDRKDLHNGVISTGQTAEGVPVQGSKIETDGPLRWGGPFGRVPFGHSSPLLTSSTAAEADASTLLERLVRERVAPITVECVANPALEWNDAVQLVLPNKNLVGIVRSITWTLPAKTMTMTVLVPRSQLWSV
jgi:hypothetical protein